MTDSYNRPHKNAARVECFARLRSPAPYASILTLPSREALCVEEMARQGLIDRHTRQQWVEHSKTRERHLNLNSRKFSGQVTVHIGSLEDHVLTGPVDLINADMESTLTPRLGLWFENEVRQNFVPGGDIILTVTQSARNNVLHEWMKDNFEHPLISTQMAALQARMGHDFKPFIIPTALMHCAMQMTAERINAHCYQDEGHRPMVSLVFQNVHDNPGVWPLLSELIEVCDHTRAEMQPTSRVQSPLERKLADFFADLLSADLLFEDDLWVVRMPGSAVNITQQPSLEKLAEAFKVS